MVKIKVIFLGPLSDTFRKTILAVPFIGHLIAGVVPFLVLYLQDCPPQVNGETLQEGLVMTNKTE